MARKLLFVKHCKRYCFLCLGFPRRRRQDLPSKDRGRWQPWTLAAYPGICRGDLVVGGIEKFLSGTAVTYLGVLVYMKVLNFKTVFRGRWVLRNLAINTFFSC
jgi:hypothetical protein